METSALDQELAASLMKTLDKTFALFLNSLYFKCKPFISPTLMVLLTLHHLSTNSASYSQLLLNRYYKSLSTIAILLKVFLDLVFPNIVDILFSKLSLIQKYPNLRDLIRRIIPLASLIGLLAKIEGTFEGLTDLVLGLRTTWRNPDVRRVVDFEFMNRNVVWNVVAELVPEIYSILGKVWKPKRIGFAEGCHICGETISVPWKAQCGCDYCYYCLRSNLIEDPNFLCLKCGVAVKEIFQ
ncbi:peroxisome assembly protein (Peroxin-2), partial [Nowakowskiella sp. JEL0078]